MCIRDSGCSPNGRNINDGCGSTAPELLQLTVPGVRAQVGLALDGDGDRVVMVDELGRCVDGDQLLYVLAAERQGAGTLKGPVVGTVMSNLGLEHALGDLKVAFQRAQVGDRYVLAMLNETGGTLGGETSGHILCLDKTTTGDGLVSALQVLALMKSSGAGLAELTAPMRKYPQVLLNVRVARRFDPMTEPAVLEVAQAVERQFEGRGRIVLRASGTEPVIRVMVEGADANLVKKGARDIAAAVEAVADRLAVTGPVSYTHLDVYKRQAYKIIQTNMDKLQAMSEALIKYETIDEEQIKDIMEGRVPRPVSYTHLERGAGGGGGLEGRPCIVRYGPKHGRHRCGGPATVDVSG